MKDWGWGKVRWLKQVVESLCLMLKVFPYSCNMNFSLSSFISYVCAYIKRFSLISFARENNFLFTELEEEGENIHYNIFLVTNFLLKTTILFISHLKFILILHDYIHRLSIEQED
jgi:hypothetical protein